MKASLIVLSVMASCSLASNLRGDPATNNTNRRLATYYTLTTSELGGPDPDSAIGNPLRGLMESPIYTWPPYEADIPLSLEFYYVGMDEIMKGNPDVVGEEAAFDWSVLEDALAGSASRNMHAVWRIICHFPGKETKVPKYLRDAGVQFHGYSGGTSPDYGDSLLVQAMGQLITRLGQRYDGDFRLGFLQAGFLGFWGEWHTSGNDFIPEETKDKVVGWFSSSFQKTQIQVRYPWPSAYQAGFGLHDDSFGYSTLDGDANGGKEVDHYFWPLVKKAGQEDFWMTGAMGGETRGELQQEIFEPWYPARSYRHQDFLECTEVTHATYMFHHAAFKNGGFAGDELWRARNAHARMGYNFHVPSVSVMSSSASGMVNVQLTVTQIGVAPFYYPLRLAMSCSGMTTKTIAGVESTLVEKDDSHVFEFTGIPATPACLDEISVSLISDYVYSGRPVKFAQGDGTIAFGVPLPDGNVDVNEFPAPTGAPVTSQPVESPATAPSALGPPSAACGMENYSNECTSTGACEDMYYGVTDCDVQGGGVCLCNQLVCGCRDAAALGEPTCFSSSNTVEIQGHGEVSIDNVRIGDHVRAANGEFSRVYSFSHIERDAHALYLQITAHGLDKPLEISRNHMLFVGGAPLRAIDVKVGDLLGNNEVVAIKTVQRKGIYAPVTTSGAIMVSGVVASCYVALPGIPASTQHAAIQAGASIHRLICTANFEMCQNETYTVGHSNFTWKLVKFVRELPVVFQLIFAAAVSPFVAAAVLVEKIALIPFLPTTLLYLFGLFVWQKTRSSTSKASPGKRESILTAD